MVVLGSREQMCINPDVRGLRGRMQNHACRSLVKSRTCHHYNRVAGKLIIVWQTLILDVYKFCFIILFTVHECWPLDYLKVQPELGSEPIDIEDLVNIGKEHGP